MRGFSFTALLLLSLAAAPASGDENDEDDVEEVEDVEEVRAEPAAASPSTPGLSDALGRFHPVLVHFPIAWLLLALMAELWALLRRSARELVARASPWLLLLTTLAAVPVVVTGLLRAASQSGAAAEVQARVLLHRNLGLATLGAVLVAVSLRLVLRRRLSLGFRLLYLGALAGAAVLVVIAGHLGGVLVHGEGYLRSPF